MGKKWEVDILRWGARGEGSRQGDPSPVSSPLVIILLVPPVTRAWA